MRIKALPTILLFAVSILGGAANAQFPGIGSPKIWLQGKKTNAADSGLFNSGLIGAHHLLNRRSTEVHKALQDISLRRSGTCFLVIREDDLDTNELELSLGPIQVSSGDICIYGHRNSHNIKPHEAAIIRATYQVSNKSGFNRIYWDDSLQIAEVIYFDQNLSVKKSRQVTSYLALKYSINITYNKSPKLRYYNGYGKDRVWELATDGEFDEEVLAVGRYSPLNFSQASTVTPDHDSIQMTLLNGENISWNDETSVSQRDSSLITLQKREANLSDFSPVCDVSWPNRLFKIKLINWHNKNVDLGIKLKTKGINNIGKYKWIITDGREVNRVRSHVDSTKLSLYVKLPDNVVNKNFYIIPKRNLDCDNNIRVSAEACVNGTKGNISFNVDSDELPLVVLLNSMSSNYSEILKPKGGLNYFKNVLPGSYNIKIMRGRSPILDKIVTLDGCNDNQPEVRDSSLSNISNYNDVNVDSQAFSDKKMVSPYVEFYPNPIYHTKYCNIVFHNLKNETFKIRVFDDAGKLTDMVSFKCQRDISHMLYRFPMEGNYRIDFNSSSFNTTLNAFVR